MVADTPKPATGSRDMTGGSFTRGPGDIQTAVVNLVDRLAPSVPVPRQPHIARKIAKAIASRPNSMANNMFLRQSIIRGGTATQDHVVEGLAAWVTVLFDLANLQKDRDRALDLKVAIPDEALTRLAQALSRSGNGCILATPHIGGVELLVAHLVDRGVDIGFIYTISDNPTPTERWIYAGRAATGGTPIAFGRNNTGAEISNILQKGGLVFMVVDVYPTARYKGIMVKIFGTVFNYPPGPARFARSGTLILPGYATRRDAKGFSMNILAPIDYQSSMPEEAATSHLTQTLAGHISGFTEEHPESYWLWHPIPNDPFLAVAQRQRPDLLSVVHAAPPDDEAVALAVDELSSAQMV
jgi:lauroyl/myristoyl acyltransferase